MGKPSGLYVKWDKPVTQGQILYDSTHVWSLEESNAWAKKVEWWPPGGGVGNCGLKEDASSGSHSVMPDSLRTHGLQPDSPLSIEFSRQEHWGGLPFPSPGESSQPRDQTQVSYLAGRLFTVWATREIPLNEYRVSVLQDEKVLESFVQQCERTQHYWWWWRFSP